MNYIWGWLIIGLLGYIAGVICDLILYERKLKEGVDIDVLILSIVLGPFTWLVVFNAIAEHITWKRRKRK